MKVKLEVLVPFTDKNDRTVRYKKGDTVAFDDIDRINDLIARGVCRLVAIEDDAPVTSATNEIAIGDKAYPLAAVKVALEAVGVAVAKNAGVPAVTKALDALTEEQTAALAEVLAAKEE
ncbi:MAG: hypothetical protein OSJ35_05735 [Alistipes sp.]|nr:hypothetical protein [Alistipes sp.]